MAKSTKRKIKILLTGANGFLGQALIRLLPRQNFSMVALSRRECDVTNIGDCLKQIRDADVVVHAAGLVVSRVEQQARPAEVLFQNLAGTANVFEAAARNGIPKIITIGSMTAYPESAPSPLREESLWEGLPVLGNLEYGVSKRMAGTFGSAYARQYGMQACTIILPNLYGPGDKINYNPPPLVANIIIQLARAARHNDSEFMAGNNGETKLDLLYIDDAAKAVIGLLRLKELPPVVNVGAGKPVAIKTVVDTVARSLYFRGRIRWEKPDRVPQPRYVDVRMARALLGNIAQTGLGEGLKKTVEWYRKTTND